jgi:hypothetical protein
MAPGKFAGPSVLGGHATVGENRLRPQLSVPRKCITARSPRWGLVRTCVASLETSASFGPMLAAEAQERRFYEASRRAFVGDGAAYNWAIWQGYFRDFEPIVRWVPTKPRVGRSTWGVSGRAGKVGSRKYCGSWRSGKRVWVCCRPAKRRRRRTVVTRGGWWPRHGVIGRTISSGWTTRGIGVIGLISASP